MSIRSDIGLKGQDRKLYYLSYCQSDIGLKGQDRKLYYLSHCQSDIGLKGQDRKLYYLSYCQSDIGLKGTVVKLLPLIYHVSFWAVTHLNRRNWLKINLLDSTFFQNLTNFFLNRQFKI